jgi:hypothetical protein
VNPHYIVQVPTTLVLKEKAFTFSDDDFAVKDQHGAVVVRCRGSAMSFRDSKSESRLLSVKRETCSEQRTGKCLLHKGRKFERCFRGNQQRL